MVPDAETSPTARALLTLELVQNRPGIGAAAIGDRLGVSERAARRYIAILREAEIPIESVRGRYGGYRVGRGLRLAPLMFTDVQALGLVMAVLDGHHQVSDPDDPVGGAFDKIVRAMPESLAAQVQAVRQTAAPAPDRGAARPDPGITVELVRACSQRRRVLLDYRTEAGSQWSVEADPYSVVVRHGRWYLLCFSHRVAARRAFRVDRVQQVRMLDETFDPPADLDPITALEQQLASGWEYEVEVAIDAPAEAVTRCLPSALGRVEPVDDAHCRLAGSTSDPWWYAEQLARVPATFRIVRGDEVQAKVRAIGHRMLAASGELPPGPGS
jgi:predicted DNA-binding transcriptional regulator YafY